jgi:uncharacterized protein (TIGR00369 family)
MPTQMPVRTDAEIREVLRTGQDMPPTATMLSMTLIDFNMEKKWAEFHFNPGPETRNPAGTIQGGFLAVMLDDVMAISASISQGFNIVLPTLQMTLSYYRPVFPGKIRVRGEVMRISKSACHMRGFVFDEAGELCTEAVAAAVPRPWMRAE